MVTALKLIVVMFILGVVFAMYERRRERAEARKKRVWRSF